MLVGRIALAHQRRTRDVLDAAEDAVISGRMGNPQGVFEWGSAEDEAGTISPDPLLTAVTS